MVRDGVVVNKIKDLVVRVIDDETDSINGFISNNKKVNIIVNDLRLGDVFIYESTIINNFDEKNILDKKYFRNESGEKIDDESVVVKTGEIFKFEKLNFQTKSIPNMYNAYIEMVTSASWNEIVKSMYLMGFIPSSEVPDIKILIPQDPNNSNFQNVPATTKIISIQTLIQTYGDRVPSYQNSQKNFKMAYILLTKKGQNPAQYQIDDINFVAKDFPIEWNTITNGKSTINSQ